MNRRRPTLPLLCACLALAACQTRSLSDPGLRSTNRLYRGELRELDVIGAALDPTRPLAEDLSSWREPRLRRGGRVLLVQSGALVPDPELVAAFGEVVEVTTLSGIPAAPDTGGGGTADHSALRLAAARGGLDAIVCVWGMFETAQRDLDGKVVSWVPFVGWTVPDQALDTRLRLRFLLVDTASGRWSAFEPEPATDSRETSPFDRDLADEATAAGADQALQLARTALRSGARAFLARHLDR